MCNMSQDKIPRYLRIHGVNVERVEAGRYRISGHFDDHDVDETFELSLLEGKWKATNHSGHGVGPLWRQLRWFVGGGDDLTAILLETFLMLELEATKR